MQVGLAAGPCAMYRNKDPPSNLRISRRVLFAQILGDPEPSCTPDSPPQNIKFHWGRWAALFFLQNNADFYIVERAHPKAHMDFARGEIPAPKDSFLGLSDDFARHGLGFEAGWNAVVGRSAAETPSG